MIPVAAAGPEASAKSFIHWLFAAAVAIFLVAIALRMPSCYESFWLDELHSAWVVADGLGQVTGRAYLGHQSPHYFYGLWAWRQLFGDGELALRMTSVLATSLGCGLLTLGVGRWCRSVPAGIAAGMILAIEQNAIFFGTELRPYSVVICLAVIATVCFLPLADSRSRRDHPRLWSALVISILVSAIAQPTSLGVLAWLPLALLANWAFRDRRDVYRVDAVDTLLLLAAAATVGSLWVTTLGDSWRERSQWASFGSASRIDQIADSWDWLWLCVVPAAIAIMIWGISLRTPRGPNVRRICRSTLSLALIAFAATCGYWIVSRMQWVPIWHRRYFVAALPLLACVCGCSVGSLHRLAGSSSRATFVAGVTAVALVLGVASQQQTLRALRTYPVALASRGEDWRGAVQWINQHLNDSDLILLDSGLIEAKPFLAISNQENGGESDPGAGRSGSQGPLGEYLRFPVLGPYAINRSISLYDPQTGTRIDVEGAAIRPIDRWIVLTRQPSRQAKLQLTDDSRVIPFGGVSVILQNSPDQNQR